VSERNSQQQKNALETKVIHHHHISKGIWAAIILFILLSLESAGWLNTVNKLDKYSENDTKYRFMRLDTTAKKLQIYLDSTDARYKSDPNLLNIVVELEDQFQKNMERLEKAEKLKHEAKDLENKVHIR
jgi:predicted RND superfamily exporter protein